MTRRRAVLCLIAWTLFGCPGRPESAPAAREAGPIDRGRAERELLLLVNQERQRAGVDVLTLDATLAQAAQEHAEDQVARSYFAHQSPEGLGPAERVEKAGYGGGAAGGGLRAVGENLAEQLSSAEGALRAWMGSPPHRRNLLDPAFREMGLGLAVGSGSGRGTRRTVWVLILGSRAQAR